MKQTTAAITHFCGDPLITLFWLHMYKKYWRGEVDKLYIYNSYNLEVIDEQLVELQRNAIRELPEALLFENMKPVIPELANSFLLSKVEENTVFFLESDGWVFRRNWLTKQMLQPIISGSCGIVGSNYELFPSSVSPHSNINGFMRNVLSCDMELIRKTDLDFNPKSLSMGERVNSWIVPQDINLDCFGWMSYQLLTLTDRIVMLPYANMIDSPTNPLDFNTYPFIHVRQFSSSYLGFTFPLWRSLKENSTDRFTTAIKQEAQPTGSYSAPRWHLTKGIAFRQIFAETLKNYKGLEAFRNEYLEILDKMIDLTQLDRHQIKQMTQQYTDILRP